MVEWKNKEFLLLSAIFHPINSIMCGKDDENLQTMGEKVIKLSLLKVWMSFAYFWGKTCDAMHLRNALVAMSKLIKMLQYIAKAL